MEQYSRDFKGVWIPKEIYLATELSWAEKILLIEIHSLDKGDGCWASNEHFASFLNKSEGSIANSISKLRKDGWIIDRSFDGRKRYISLNEERLVKAGFTKMLRQGSQKCEGRVHNFVNENSSQMENDGLTEPQNDDEATPNNTYNNTYNNISVSPGKLKDNINLDKEKETDSTFEVTPTDEWGVPLSQGKKPKRKVERSEFIPTVFKLFGELLGQDGKFPSFWMFKPDFKDSAMRLEEERGIVAVKSALLFFKANRKNTYCPKVTNPQMLEEKWDDLLLFKNRKNEE